MRITMMAHRLRVAGGLTGGRNLLTSLLDVAPQHDYQFLVPENCGYEFDTAGRSVEIVPVPLMVMAKRIPYDLFRLPRMIERFRPDLLWGLGNAGLKCPPCRQAILCRDAHFTYPLRHYQREVRWYRFSKYLVKRHLIACLPATEIVFCQTRTMARRFAETLPFTGRICLCPNAVSRFLELPADPAVPGPLRPYRDRFRLFTLTKYYAHKNLEGIVDMYDRYRKELAGTVCVLTIAPDQHALAPALIRRIEKLRLQDLIVNVGPLSQKQLADYYLACDALFMPTLLESFSVTYLEAMHFGRPILTSDLDFAREVCDDAASYFDPWNPASMRDAVLALAADKELAASLVAKGRQRLAGMFHSWPDVVRGALDDLNVPHQ